MSENPRFDPKKSEVYRGHIEGINRLSYLLIDKYQIPQSMEESRTDATIWLGNRISGFLVEAQNPLDRESILPLLTEAVAVANELIKNNWRQLKGLLQKEARVSLENAAGRPRLTGKTEAQAQADEREAAALINIARALINPA